jgi:O-antigen ligase
MWLIVLTEGYVALQINLTYYSNHINALQEYGFSGMDNNSFAISLVTTLGPAVALAVSPGKWWMRLLAAAAALFILHAALVSFSRGGMVGLCVAGVVAFIAMPKRPKYLLGLLLVAALAYRLTGREIVARMNTMFVSDGERDGSSQSRIDLWRDCLRVTMTHPIFGVGPDNWPIVASSFGWAEGKQAHSAWMQAMAETGFVGLSLVLGFFSLTAFRMWRRVRIRGPSAWIDADRVLATGIVAGLAGYIASAQFVTILGLETPYYVVLVAVIMLRATDMAPVAQPVVAKSIPERGPKSRALGPGFARPRVS